MAFLVRPRGDLDDASCIAVKDAGELQPINDAQGAVEPAAIGLGLAMRTDQQPAAHPGIAADHITNPVDHRIEPRFAEFIGQPMPRLDVDRRIGRPVDPGLVAAEFCKPLQIRDNALSVDGWHIFTSL